MRGIPPGIEVDVSENRSKEQQPSPENPSHAIIFLLLFGGVNHLLDNQQAFLFGNHLLFHNN